MKKILIYLIMSIPLFSKTITKTQNYSDKYTISVTANIDENEKSDKIYSEAVILLIDKKTKKTIAKINSEIPIDIKNKDINLNSSLPNNIINYDFEAIIIHEDFNFDGKKDFAILNDGSSCYGGPAYSIYIETKKGLKYSSEFTNLIAETCGMFKVDYENKKIYAFSKSGAATHYYYTFKVVGDKPILMESVTEQHRRYVLDILKETYIGNKTISKQQYTWHDFDKTKLKKVYSLNFKNSKQMILYEIDNIIIYVFENKGNIDLYYANDFYYDKDKKTLSFINDNIKYEIYNGGIIITKGKKKINIKAIRKNDKNLNIDLNLENVYKK
ncbi:XAC2610-related protein [Oceanivirga salmonicida]|uniref:XAC2610-related protein n=1 Tax=Oceanivirga salmonicida TaxID=1769291 RepID=UPI00082E58C0|nr:hypothetical protein [Oceanivirga salmonicida]